MIPSGPPERLEPVNAKDVTIQRMYYTLCPSCGALEDWSDDPADARVNRKAHLDAHRRSAVAATQ
jgi:hypothetical protein